MLISVVFSFRNEALVLPELLARLDAVFAKLPDFQSEYLFVNDDSNDSSLDILVKRAKGDPRVKVLTMSRRFGVEECFRAGIDYARGDAVITLDTDLQDPPDLIPKLIEKWKEGADVVYTVRTRREGESWLRRVLTRAAYHVIKFLADVELPVEAGSYKLINRRVVEQVRKLQEREPFMRALIQWVGFKQIAVYYKREARFAGRSKFPVVSKGTFKAFVTGIISFSDVPLYFVFISGFVVSLAAFGNFLYIVVKKIMDLNLPGWSAIMASILLLGGFQILSTGILALYIAKIHKDVKRRPTYIVKDSVNINDITFKAVG